MNNLNSYLLQYIKDLGVELPHDEISEFTSFFKEKDYKKGEHLVIAGEKTFYMAFILKGLVRFYFNTLDGKNFNQTFKKENDLIVDYFSALEDAPALFSIQALEDTKVILADYRIMNSFYEKHPNWNKLGRIIIENNFIIKAKREAALLQLSAMDRYLDFKLKFKELLPRLTQQDIALYLGVDPSSLNRLIKKNNLD